MYIKKDKQKKKMSSNLGVLYFLISGGECSRYGAFATIVIDFFCNLIDFDNLDLYVFPHKVI